MIVIIIERASMRCAVQDGATGVCVCVYVYVYVCVCVGGGKGDGVERSYKNVEPKAAHRLWLL